MRLRSEPQFLLALTEIRNQQSSLAESFDAAVKVLGVSEWQDAAAAFDGEVRVDLERLLPRLSGILRAAEMAIT